ncbi:MAG TPA: hypothetical protein VGN34_25650 [Ktedonobacteraceae bacterium]|jgi:hypothetical protein
MKEFSVFVGALNYEFRMQARRWVVWATLLLIGLMFLLIFSHSTAFFNEYIGRMKTLPLCTAIGSWASLLNDFVPIGLGCVLADRLVRDRRFKTQELFATMQGSSLARLAGKYVGSVLATTLPILVIYGLGIACILWLTGNILAIPVGLLALVTIMLPGYLFIGAFSLACPLVMWVPLYQFLFACYWFWGNILSPHVGIPTISETILTPIGRFAAEGYFHIHVYNTNITATSATASIIVLLLVAAIVLLAAWRVQQLLQTRQ